MRFVILMPLLSLSLIGCQATRLDKSASAPEQAQNVTLTRVLQRVVRHDCHGKVITDQLENLTPAAQIVSIDTNRDLRDMKVFNASTNSSVSCRLGITTFSISDAGADCSMRVQPGLNEIHYGQFFCESDECEAHPEKSESGTIYLNVEIQTEILGGIESIQRECAKAEEKSKKGESSIVSLSRKLLKKHPLSFDFNP